MEEDKTISSIRSSIFEALGAYNAWKMILFSRSKSIVSQEMAFRYVEIQKYHGQFFIAAQNAFLFEFVIQILHIFDRDPKAASLFNLDKEVVEKFILENRQTFDSLKSLRDKVFAHKDKYVLNNSEEIKIPSIDKLDDFFKKVTEVFNNYTSKKYLSSTFFDDAYRVKEDIEYLFMNLYRGESMRNREIDIEYLWLQDQKKASDVL